MSFLFRAKLGDVHWLNNRKTYVWLTMIDRLVYYCTYEIQNMRIIVITRIDLCIPNLYVLISHTNKYSGFHINQIFHLFIMVFLNISERVNL